MSKKETMATRPVVALVLAALLMCAPGAQILAQHASPAEGLASGLASIRLLPEARSPDKALYLSSDDQGSWWELETRVLGKSAAASGGFEVFARYELEVTVDVTQKQLIEQRGVRRFERSMVVGTHHGADGTARHLSGMLLDIAIFDEDTGAEHAVKVLMPLTTSDNLEALDRLSIDLSRLTAHESLDVSSSPETEAPASGFEKCAADPCIPACEQARTNALSICTLESHACLGLASGATVGCILACPSTGPAAIACLLVCGVVDVSGALLCLVNHYRCVDAADDEFVECKLGCLQGPDERSATLPLGNRH